MPLARPVVECEKAHAGLAVTDLRKLGFNLAFTWGNYFRIAEHTFWIVVFTACR
jgi:hypothetical protein